MHELQQACASLRSGSPSVTNSGSVLSLRLCDASLPAFAELCLVALGGYVLFRMQRLCSVCRGSVNPFWGGPSASHASCFAKQGAKLSMGSRSSHCFGWAPLPAIVPALPSRHAYLTCAGDLGTALGGFSASHASCSANEGAVLCRDTVRVLLQVHILRTLRHVQVCAAFLMQRSGTAEIGQPDVRASCSASGARSFVVAHVTQGICGLVCRGHFAFRVDQQGTVDRLKGGNIMQEGRSQCHALERTVLRPVRPALPKQDAVPLCHFIGDWCSVGVYCFAESTFYGQVTKHILWGGHSAFRAYCAAKQGEHCM